MFQHKSWMGNLPQNLHIIPIIYLAIPGTHDSFSYSINHESSLSPDAPVLAKILNPYLGCLLRRVVCRWSVTQSDNIKQQLENGIRYFDIRVATKPKDNRIYSCHSLFGLVIKEALNEINTYLNEFEKEVVILDFQHFYQFNEQSHRYLKCLINYIFKEKVCPLPQNITDVTLRWLWAHKYQVIVIYRDDHVAETSFWPSEKWMTLWPDTTDVNMLRDFLDCALKFRPQRTGYVSQCVLTPSIQYIMRYVFSNLKDQCCRVCNHFMQESWLIYQKAGSIRGVNVIISDFVTLDNLKFSSIVIQRNYALSYRIRHPNARLNRFL